LTGEHLIPLVKLTNFEWDEGCLMSMYNYDGFGYLKFYHQEKLVLKIENSIIRLSEKYSGKIRFSFAKRAIFNRKKTSNCSNREYSYGPQTNTSLKISKHQNNMHWMHIIIN
jgi:hypothetical protein